MGVREGVSEDFCLLRENPTGEGAVAVCEGGREGELVWVLLGERQ